jgi:hypothetical protein
LSNKIPKDFAGNLKEELFNSGAHTIISSTGGYVEDVVVSAFPADCHMVHQIINNKAVMAMTTELRYSNHSRGLLHCY